MKQNVYIEIIRQLSLSRLLKLYSNQIGNLFLQSYTIVFNLTKILSLIAFRVSRLENY